MSETNEASVQSVVMPLPDVFRVKCWPSGQFAVFKQLASGKYEMRMENDCKSQEITNDTAAGYFLNGQETWVRVQA
jgi:hypothetical protein